MFADAAVYGPGTVFDPQASGRSHRVHDFPACEEQPALLVRAQYAVCLVLFFTFRQPERISCLVRSPNAETVYAVRRVIAAGMPAQPEPERYFIIRRWKRADATFLRYRLRLILHCLFHLIRRSLLHPLRHDLLAATAFRYILICCEGGQIPLIDIPVTDSK